MNAYDYEKILNMTDEEAADILDNYILRICGGRGNGKTLLSFSYFIAIKKAIKKLRGS